MELIDLIFKSRNIEPTVTVTAEPDVVEGFYQTVEKYGISRNDTLHGLPVSISVDKLWHGTKCVAVEYTLISHKTVRNMTGENFMELIREHI